MKAHGISLPLRVKDSSVAAGILGNVCGFGAELFVGREKGLAGSEALGDDVEMDGVQFLRVGRKSVGTYLSDPFGSICYRDP